MDTQSVQNADPQTVGVNRKKSGSPERVTAVFAGISSQDRSSGKEFAMISYNKKKLTTNMDAMSKISIFNAGLGAVGSQAEEHQVKMGIGHIVGADRDSYEADNFAKCSGVIRYPEDVGKPKAEACAARLREIAHPGTVIGSLAADVTRLGPRAFARFDYVLNSLDNATAKIHMNRMIRMCRPEERPILLSCGTNGDVSEANIYVEGGACLRCGMPDEWLDQPDRSWSCTGGADYLIPARDAGIVSTSGMASCQSALDALSLIDAHAKGQLPKRESMRIVHSPFPFKHLSLTRLERREGCPECELVPPDSWIELNAGIYTLTLREAFEMISHELGHNDYYIRVHELILPDRDSDRCYNQYITNDRCRVCGKKIPIYQHTGRIRDDQIICRECHEQGLDEVPVNRQFDDAEIYMAFRPGKCGESILDKTLYELGYPVGAYIEVNVDEQHLTSGMEDNTIIFVCSDDPDFIYNSNNLNLT